MGYRLVADLAMVAHFGFLGGFVALWRRWVLWPHVVAVGLGVLDRADVLAVPADERGELGSRTFRGCPAQRHRLHRPLHRGVIYPEEHTRLLQALVLLVVIVSWVAVARQRAPVRLAPATRDGSE